ncbi:MAG: hypothetical protein EXR55_05850 [Dehalococcoidia bacterium]|nr:hypothetical protein [Dehalococcoidia bacterium]
MVNRLPDYGSRGMVPDPNEGPGLPQSSRPSTGRGNEAEVERFRHGAQELVRLFAQVSGDHNPYHLDPEYARQSRYQGPIGHGILTVCLALAELSRALPSFVPVEIDVTRFTAPVRFGDRVRCVVLNAERERNGWLVNFVVTNQDIVVILQGNIRVWPRSPEDGPSSWRQVLNRPAEELRADAVAWSRGVQAFPVRPAPQLRVGQSERYDTAISEERLKANVVISKDSSWMTHLFALEAVAQASAELSPGFILVGAEAGGIVRPLRVGEPLRINATVTRQGVLLHRPVDRIRIDMQVLDAAGQLVASGAVYKESEAPIGQAPTPTPTRPYPGAEFLVPADPRLLGALSRLHAPPFLTILDLGEAEGDEVAAARQAVVRHLEGMAQQQPPASKGYLFLRPHSFRSPWAAADLLEVMGKAGHLLDGILLPDARGPRDVEVADQVLAGIEEARGWERGRLKIEVVIQQWDVARRAADIMDASPRVVAIANALVGSLATPELNMTLAQAAESARVDLVDGTARPQDDGRETALGAIRGSMMRFRRKWAFNPLQLNAVLNPQLYLSDRDLLRGGIPKDWTQTALTHQPGKPTLWKEGVIDRAPRPSNANPMPLAELEAYARQERPLL